MVIGKEFLLDSVDKEYIKSLIDAEIAKEAEEMKPQIKEDLKMLVNNFLTHQKKILSLCDIVLEGLGEMIKVGDAADSIAQIVANPNNYVHMYEAILQMAAIVRNEKLTQYRYNILIINDVENSIKEASLSLEKMEEYISGNSKGVIAKDSKFFSELFDKVKASKKRSEELYKLFRNMEDVLVRWCYSQEYDYNRGYAYETFKQIYAIDPTINTSDKSIRHSIYYLYAKSRKNNVSYVTSFGDDYSGYSQYKAASRYVGQSPAKRQIAEWDITSGISNENTKAYLKNSTKIKKSGPSVSTVETLKDFYYELNAFRREIIASNIKRGSEEYYKHVTNYVAKTFYDKAVKDIGKRTINKIAKELSIEYKKNPTLGVHFT